MTREYSNRVAAAGPAFIRNQRPGPGCRLKVTNCGDARTLIGAAGQGFDGKAPIRPTTPAAANKVFGPTAPEVGHADRVNDAHRTAPAEGKGVVLLDGKLSAMLHAENAEGTASEAAAILEPARASG
ncbi:MAG: hypothetical protein OXF78_04805 [Rhodospirillales bacterium]|nr:hypothetical protein [Rhodospirillales bacterium]